MVYLVQTKWGNAKKSVYGNLQYDSKFEASYAQELDLRVRAKDIRSWDRQKTLDLIVNGYKIASYRIDFVVYHNDDTIEYVETKGYATPIWRLKWKLFEALYSDKPDVKLTVVQQRNNFRVPKPNKI